ncbi:MAG: AMP-binding protein [Deltaproteobacteria bacterium]|nr:AMP-binding protein [Deltaproteobacteria bacterium]MBW2017884.1 AMP-binding protein [Deltaproteobacteria bacterium]MBW2130570.1 AMP-binding protein [Deltaproteobacteria bacterium]MBW2304709.1 AMP-binding protein [Deltaproteobacteria bacterium]
MHIGEMLARNARMYPDDVALVERIPAENVRKEVTWKQFDDEANRFANLLVEKGVGKGDRVVHLMMNSIEWLVTYFGILRTGAWVVPLNFRFTGADIKYCIDVAEPKVVIFGEEFTERIEEIKETVPVRDYLFTGEKVPEFADSVREWTPRTSPEPPDVELYYDDSCALYFTSGTTGRPKPILLAHKNLVCAAITEKVHHGQERHDNFILIPPLYHTGAKMHWFGSLIVGGRAVILKGVSPEWIFEAVSEEGGTILWLLVPWVQDILLKLDRGEMRLDDYRLEQLRLLHIGAMPVPPSLIQRWKGYFPHMDYDTTYGLSEATGPNCVHLGVENTHKVGAIGRSGFNWETRIVDEEGRDVKQGEVGELIVRGGGVMREYYKNPEATAAALKDGWLHTGDMARQDEDGFIYLVDRKKDVIICGGENVFPVEVENHLHTHKGIKDAAAIGYPDERLGEIVAVVIECVPGTTLTEEEVLAHCKALPRYKRPRKVFFGEIPRNPTGKIEKTKLRRRYIGREEAFRVS